MPVQHIKKKTMIKISDDKEEIQRVNPRNPGQFRPEVQISLTDWLGNRVKLGDRIVIEMPMTEVAVSQTFPPTDEGIREICAKKITGILHHRLGSGLYVKVEHIQRCSGWVGDREEGVNPYIALKYTKYRWYKHNPYPF